jgi:hypothetical protein
MINTIRILYPQIHSRVGDYIGATKLTLTWLPIHRDSIVLISASEYRQIGVQGDTPVIDRFLGDAPISINNVAPEEGVVNFYITIDYKTPIDVAVDFVIIDPPANMVDASSGAVYSLAAPVARPAAHASKPTRSERAEGH